MNRLTGKSYPDDSTVNYTYDLDSRLTQVTDPTGTYQFTFDNMGRLSSATTNYGFLTGRSFVTSYGYDAASNRTSFTDPENGSTALGNLTYGYDLNGRRTSVGGSYARTGLPLAVSQTAYNANNQLTTWGTANLFYDLNGNMTSSGTDGYTWDARNRLISTLSGASFQYDSFGRRASKTIGGTTTSFLYEGANVVQEIMGGSNTANSLTRGVDEVFQRTDSAGARSFLTDALGSGFALADSSGTLQTQYTFEPFGNTSATGAASTNSFAYTGRELDATGLYFYRARYYSPSLQRFISEDPSGFAGGWNPYAYVLNSPLNWVDPLGLVNCTYYISDHTLICFSNDDSQLFITDNVRSGNGKWMNDPSSVCVGYHGPIPPGNFDLGPLGKTPNKHPIDRVPIYPQKGTNMYGRDVTGQFQIHPGGPDNSKGCITINPADYQRFKNFYQIDNSGFLHVTD